MAGPLYIADPAGLFRRVELWARRRWYDLGELDGLISAMERNAAILSDPRHRPTREEREVYARRRAELALTAPPRIAIPASTVKPPRKRIPTPMRPSSGIIHPMQWSQ